ncbi:hypothetical protein GCM10022198_06440 [Klugiella xanthotipulae]|uniref:hypothetical protein n=1 Tax=Klugiella xanthotipulae TaxID=244735 RepID=UPI001476AEA0|nr:hypothetical protein [Klugiella xanthotipulae]
MRKIVDVRRSRLHEPPHVSSSEAERYEDWASEGGALDPSGPPEIDDDEGTAGETAAQE